VDLAGVGRMQYARGVQCFVKKVSGVRGVHTGFTVRN
jgi:hypothetical protein